MREKTVGIMAAMAEELRPLRGDLRLARKRKVAGLEVLEGTLYGREVVLLQSGMGKIAAAMAAQLLLCRYPVRLLILTGVAGAACADCHAGDIVIASELVEHDVGVKGMDGFTALGSVGIGKNGAPSFYRSFRPAGAIMDCAREAAARWESEPANRGADSPGVHEGPIATGDQFVFDPEERQRIFHQFSALAIDTEAAAVAKVAAANGVDYLVIKAISDGSGDTLGVDAGHLTAFQRESQSFLQKVGSVGSALGYLAGDPAAVSRLLKMRRNTAAAAANAAGLVKYVVQNT